MSMNDRQLNELCDVAAGRTAYVDRYAKVRDVIDSINLDVSHEVSCGHEDNDGVAYCDCTVEYNGNECTMYYQYASFDSDSKNALYSFLSKFVSDDKIDLVYDYVLEALEINCN